MHGELLSGLIDGASVAIVRVKLRESGINVITIKRYSKLLDFCFTMKSKPYKQKISINKDDYSFLKNSQNHFKQNRKSINRIKEQEVITFIKQFLVLLQSGVPLLRSFDIVINSAKNRGLIVILQEVKSSIENGFSLSESFSIYPKIFDRLFINFLAIGESGGILEPLLIKYVEYREKSIAIKHKVKSAMVYPVVIAIAATFLLGVVLGFVIPQFEEVFQNVGATLPTITLWVIQLSRIVSNYWWVLVLVIFFTAFIFNFLYKKRFGFRFFIDKHVLMIPIFGGVIQKTLISRWSRTLSLLFAAGVPINYALNSIANVMNNYLYGVATLNIKREVESGSSLYQSMYMTGVFPSMVSQMIAVGEESGSLECLLLSIADYYDNEVNIAIDMLLSLIEPVTIICLGIILGIIIIAIYLPLFNLGNVVG